ncbi:hypothetical protein MKW94_005998 [Papaver nudicaule]|uniref:S-protein homolog n=1 Tax=Papaver nudicaule TaxID=74823 RepID=A0AA41VA11_PAPNU|nr:hypothetical protein [Papaver nudicaule]MCL7038522.1 hypothetical protein [Papaver nudicaule]
MSKLFLVSGCVAIFSTLLSLSVLCMYAQSVDGEGMNVHRITVNGQGVFIHKKIVTVENNIDPNIAFTIHCWSSEDDLGWHTLYYKQNFFWRFKVNIWMSTKFMCDSSWHDPAGKGNQTISFLAYDAERDWKVYCKNDCRWSIRRDGGYYGDGTDLEFPFKKVLSYP